MTPRSFGLLGCSLWVLSSAAHAETNAYTYDALGRLATAVIVDGGVTYNIAYSYDAAGNRTQVVNGGVANTPPVAVTDAKTTTQNTALNFNPRKNDTDADGDALVVSGKSNGTYGSVEIIDGKRLTYTPNPSFFGTDNFIYTIYDGRGGYSNGTVTMTVTAVNQPPDAVNDEGLTTNYNEPKTFDPRLNDTDPNLNDLTISSATNGSNGTVVVNSGESLTFTPNANFSGPTSFNYTISDGQGASDTATVSITVLAANLAPVAIQDSDTALAISYNNVGVRPTKTLDPRTNDTDPNSDPLTVISVTQGTKGSVTFTNSTVTYTYGTSTTSVSTTDSFSYTISDGRGGTASSTVSMTIFVEPSQ